MWQAVGAAISSWSLTEGALVWLFAALLQTTPQKAGVTLYSINNFPTWLSIIGEIIPLEPQLAGNKAIWNKLSSRLRELNDTRVRLAHHTAMGLDHDEVSLRPALYDLRTKSTKYAPLSEDEIQLFTSKLAEATLQVINLAIAVEPLLGTSPDKPDE